MTFIGALIFALCFFGIYSAHQIAFSAAPTRTIHLLLAFSFLVLAFLVAMFFKG
jgi:hypothetical protein